VGPRSDLDGGGEAKRKIRSDRPSRSLVTILTELPLPIQSYISSQIEHFNYK